jgi:hypothetical protein
VNTESVVEGNDSMGASSADEPVLRGEPVFRDDTATPPAGPDHGGNEADNAEEAHEEPIEDPRVLAAMERLADATGLPVAEQVDIFADVHARLTEALGTEASTSATTPAGHRPDPDLAG